MQNKIFIFDDVLSKNECNMMIEYYKYKGHSYTWGNTYPLSIVYEDTPLHIIECFMKIEKIICQYVSNSISIDWCEIVKWPEGSFMNPHKDIWENKIALSSITYLNDTYSDGSTYILDDIHFKPKIGRTVCFDGNCYYHGVSKVTSGERYTAPVWFYWPNDP